MATLKQRLVALRKEKGLNQDALMAVLQCSRSTISGYESGRPISTDALSALADFYGVTTDYLLCRTNERQPASGKLADAFALLLSLYPASPLVPTDLDTFLRSAASYCRAGQPAGASPLAALHGYLLGVASAMDAAAAGDAPVLLAVLNAAICAAMNSSAMMSDYYTRHTPADK